MWWGGGAGGWFASGTAEVWRESVFLRLGILCASCAMSLSKQ